jgi:GNAT superfamily N-acetyltransferase
MQIRPVQPAEYAALAALTADAYRAIDPDPDEDYYDELRDVAGRAGVADVLVAVAADGRLLGGVTYVGDPDSPLAEVDDPTAGSIRMLAVALDAQRGGVGEALTQACVDQARGEGKRTLLLHSATFMGGAHRLYTRLGFVRDERLDWEYAPGKLLLGFRFDLA